MKKIIATILILINISNSFAQLPNTDIWSLDIIFVKDSIILSNPINITKRDGYDNQPAFSPDGKYILFTSIHDDKQSDIYKYDLKSKITTQFTKTATSEYSPTFMPDGKNISVVMVEPDSVQRLWKFPLKGGEPSCIMKDVDSIGYHCWINKDSLALVMITEPASLYTVNIKTQKPKFFAENVSRCMQQGFKKNSFLFMIKSNGKYPLWKLNSSNNYDNKTRPINADVILSPSLPEKSEDYCIINMLNNPYIIYGFQSTVFIQKWASSNEYNRIHLSSYGITNITRLAISPDGKILAIVAESK